MGINRGNKKSGGWIRPERRLAIYWRDGFTCLYCGKEMLEDYFDPEARRNLTLDHLVPESKKGTNGSHNLVTCCRTCNSSKKDIPYHIFADSAALNRIKNNRRRKVDIENAKNIRRGYF